MSGEARGASPGVAGHEWGTAMAAVRAECCGSEPTMRPGDADADEGPVELAAGAASVATPPLPPPLLPSRMPAEPASAALWKPRPAGAGEAPGAVEGETPVDEPGGCVPSAGTAAGASGAGEGEAGDAEGEDDVAWSSRASGGGTRGPTEMMPRMVRLPGRK